MTRLHRFINEWLTASGVAVLLIAPSLSARAQSSTGVIRGAVADQTGAVVQGATVRLTNSITNYLQETSTGGQPRGYSGRLSFNFK